MARLANNTALQGISGKLGKQLVFKQYGDKIVVTSYPDMSGIKPSRKQKNNRNLFKDAVAYAKNINRTPALKQAYLKKIKKSESVYHYAIKEYLKKHK
jgi:hypothetical protein